MSKRPVCTLYTHVKSCTCGTCLVKDPIHLMPMYKKHPCTHLYRDVQNLYSWHPPVWPPLSMLYCCALRTPPPTPLLPIKSPQSNRFHSNPAWKQSKDLFKLQLPPENPVIWAESKFRNSVHKFQTTRTSFSFFVRVTEWRANKWCGVISVRQTKLVSTLLLRMDQAELLTRELWYYNMMDGLGGFDEN